MATKFEENLRQTAGMIPPFAWLLVGLALAAPASAQIEAQADTAAAAEASAEVDAIPVGEATEPEVELADDEGAVRLETVTVTSQKRSEDLSRVPISQSVFTRSDLERSSIRSFQDYAIRTPNVGFTQQGSSAYTRIGIRGVTNIGGRASAVGTYVDEFNIAPNILVSGLYSRTADPDLFEVGQIEVLRGPQGTYFGRNTTAGAINITSVKPELGVNSGIVKTEVDDFGGYLGSLTLNLPLASHVAVRGTAFYRNRGGFIDNLGPSGASDDGRDYGGRVALRWEASDDLRVDLSHGYADNELDLRPTVPSGELGEILTILNQVIDDFPGFFPAPLNLLVPPIDPDQFPEVPFPTTDAPFFPNNYDTIATDLPQTQRNQTGISLGRVEWNLNDSLTLTSVTGYLDNDFSLFGDGDQSPYQAFTIDRDSTSTAFSQELRLSSFGNAHFDWTVGGLFSRDSIEETDVSTHLASDPYLTAWGGLLFLLLADQGAVDPTTDPVLLTRLITGQVPDDFAPMTIGNFEDVDRITDTDSYALFGNLTWHALDTLDVSVGLRYSDDSIDFTEIARPTVILASGEVSQSGSFDDISPRLTLTWYPGDATTLYANAAKGYKVGGFNPSVSNPEVSNRFDKEDLWSYELGVKRLLLDGRIGINAAVFYIDWDDIQVRGQDVLTQRQFVQNAAAARAIGGELEFNFAVTRNLRLSLAYGYTDSEFTDFPNAIDTNGNTFDGSGNRIPLAPENTLTAAIDGNLRFKADGWRGYYRLEYSHVDDQFFDAQNDPVRALPSYGLVNGRFGLSWNDISGALFVRNALDEEYVVGTENLETYYSGIQRTPGTPRNFGIALQYSF